MKKIAAIFALGSALAGCQGFEVVQQNMFANDNGDIVSVEYGRSESDHENTFYSPGSGEEMVFKSKLAVRVTLPDGDDFVAWQCMNPFPRGTMYKTDDLEWAVMASGFSCIIYEGYDEGERHNYRPVFAGILCESPKVEVEKNDKWRVVDRPAVQALRVHEKVMQ